MFRFPSTKTNLSHTIMVDDLKAIVTEKKIKHCYIKVDAATGDVLVSLPKGTTLTAVEQLIRSKASCIQEKKSKVRGREHGYCKIFRDGSSTGFGVRKFP